MGTAADVGASVVDVDGAGASVVDVDGAGASVVDVDGAGTSVDSTGTSTESDCETSGSTMGSTEVQVEGSVDLLGSGPEIEVSDAVTEGFTSACSGDFGTEKEVLVEMGEPGTGVSGAVDSAGVVVDSVSSGLSEGVRADVFA
jgi:hypothetical protein